MKKFVRIENLGVLGDLGGIKLSTIFSDVVQQYNSSKGEVIFRFPKPPVVDTSQNVTSFKAASDRCIMRELRAVEEAVFAIKAEGELVRVFQAGRLLDQQCLASRVTAQYLLLRDLVNRELENRGFSELYVY